MKNWDQRPIEIRNLFNPAFCAIVLSRALQQFAEEDPKGMPYSLSLLVLPMCLHRETREILKVHNRSYFLKVIERNQQIRVGFGTRVRDFLPYTQEALALLTHFDCLEVSADGLLNLKADKVRKSINGTDETKGCQNAAKYLGRQFARISDRVTIYASMGVRP